MTLIEKYQRLVALNNKVALLDFLDNAQFYDTPNGNMEVQILDRLQEKATKWRTWQEVRDLEYWRQNVNNRSIGHCELVLDMDPFEGEITEEFHKRIEGTKRALITEGALIMNDYSTGGRGRHIHVLIKELARLRVLQVREFKTFVLKKFGADLAKATPRGMILIEGSINSKTGRPKAVIV